MNLSIGDMLAMQLALQKKYAGQWAPVAPESAPAQLLWAVGELGEVVDAIKKFDLMHDPLTRAHFIEEMGDVFMYLFDVLNCYGVTAEEFSDIYARKHDHNMKRDYEREHEEFREALKEENP